jgi:hypothetical protein
VANGQELKELLTKKQVDILSVQEVKLHLPVSVQGYEWLPGLDRFLRPQHHLRIGFLVKKQYVDWSGLFQQIKCMNSCG